jgi:hypothetical protein
MLQNLLDALDPPVLIFLPEGTMAFSNPSARKRLAGDLASPARHRSLLKMLHGLAGDRLPSPMRFALPFDCASGATARLDGLDIEGPNPRNAVLIADPYVPASSTLPLRQACEPSDAELRAPAPGESPAADPIEGARALAARLVTSLALVDAFTADPIAGDDRIVRHALVDEVWHDPEPAARTLPVSVSTVGLDDSPPPVAAAGAGSRGPSANASRTRSGTPGSRRQAAPRPSRSSSPRARRGRSRRCASPIAA